MIDENPHSLRLATIKMMINQEIFGESCVYLCLDKPMMLWTARNQPDPRAGLTHKNEHEQVLNLEHMLNRRMVQELLWQHVSVQL